MMLKTKIILLSIFTLFIMFFVVYSYADKMLLFLPEGKKIISKKSPNNQYMLNIYLIDGGSLSANALRGEIVKGNKKYNVYWCYSDCEFNVKVKWLDNTNIEINDLKLNINKDKYSNE